jgi:hypothetical protein
MNEIKTLIIDNLIKRTSAIIQRNNEQRTTISTKLIYEAKSKITTYQDVVYSSNKILFKKYLQISEENKGQEKLNSNRLNIFNFFHVDEKKHSVLLGMLLNQKGEHGQGNLFLIEFLKKLNIETPQIGNWIITVETGRVDIMLKRLEPHSVIIVENKSNYATDQENQLYRYWYSEIYIPTQHEGVEYSKKHPEKYKVIYLSPAQWKEPNDNSLQKPIYLGDSDLPDEIPVRPITWYFSNQIAEIIDSTLNEIHTENHRLKQYLHQYKELIISL